MTRRGLALGLLALALACLAGPAAASGRSVSGREVVDRALGALQAARRVDSVQLQPVFFPGDLALQVEGVRWEVRVLAPLEADRPRVQLSVLAGGDVLQTWIVAFRKLPVRECLVARRALRPGEALSPALFERVRRPVADGTSPVTDPAELQGCAARAGLEPGELLLRRHLVELPLVEVGEPLLVTFTSGRVSGTVAASATQRGYRGRPFRVQTRDRRSMTVWVHPDGTVRATRPGTEAGLGGGERKGS